MDENQRDDELLDFYLRTNAPAPPPAKLGEKQRIWQTILRTEQKTAWWKVLFVLPMRKTALPVVAIALPVIIVTTFLHQHKSAHDAAVERVLSAVLTDDDLADLDQDIF